ncbi:MAG: acyl-CoA thioesterase [Proteobacteria bacterium]|nr:acyl-CoA thioesterase [Pseudomonadota bacterium]
MGFKRQYFDTVPGAPQQLTATATRRVRFEEIDMLGIVWHGNYVSYLEDGRIAFGDRYGLSYMNFKGADFAAPIVQMHLDYLAPLRFDETFEVTAILHWTESLRLNFEYRLVRDGALIARGYTVQLLTDLQGRLLLAPPDMVRDFREQWQEGSL